MPNHFWLYSFIIVSIVFLECLSLPVEDYQAAPKRKPTISPMELHINFTFPENGLPPMKLNLGNVAEFLTEKPGQISSLKRVVLVNITNPNKPYKPIPAEIFHAGLPAGSLIPGDYAKPCRSYIVSKCNDLCLLNLESCRAICDGQGDCLDGCRANVKICSRFCNSTFNQYDKLKGDEQELPTSSFFLPKCLRNCRGDSACNSHCHLVCHTMMDKKPPASNPTPAGYYKASDITSEFEMDDQLPAMEDD